MNAAGWIVAGPKALPEVGEVVYCRVLYAKRAGRAPDRALGYFDGGEWKDALGVKFYMFGGHVSHWFAPPELPQ